MSLRERLVPVIAAVAVLAVGLQSEAVNFSPERM